MAKRWPAAEVPHPQRRWLDVVQGRLLFVPPGQNSSKSARVTYTYVAFANLLLS